jgi:hypothetical protein
VLLALVVVVVILRKQQRKVRDLEAKYAETFAMTDEAVLARAQVSRSDMHRI